MSFAKIIHRSGSAGDQACEATVAICLEAMRALPRDDRSRYGDFLFNLLGRQMDFIHSLHALSAEYRIDLRYLFDPATPHHLRVYHLVRVSAGSESAVLEEAERLGTYILHSLMVHNHLHEFRPVEAEEELRYLVTPFAFEHTVEIVRREDVIALDSIRKRTTRHLGFGRSGETVEPEPARAPNSCIYYVFPYALNLDTMERLCNALFLQKQPCLVSVCVKPYPLTPEDEARLEENVRICEKYEQLELHATEDVEQLTPFLKSQAGTLYKNCILELVQLQDAAFLLKVQIASSHPIPQALTTITGASITEHTGHPRPAFDKVMESTFTGGYDYYYPQNQDEKAAAIANLQNMEFRPWVPTLAELPFRHWRYLFDVSETSSAFRLPMPGAGEFPGINTIQYHIKPAPSDVPTSGLVLGEHINLNRRRTICFAQEDRSRHTYAIGKTGTGKSTLFLNMILQDVRAGRGVGVVDPHGELIEDVLLSIPSGRKKDVIYVNPQDYENPVGINMMEYHDFHEKDFCVNYLIEVFDVLYDLRQTGGPIFEQYMRNALQLLLDQPQPFGASVLDVVRLLQDWKYRRTLLENCTNIYVVSFWRKEAERAGGDAELSNVVPYINSKLCRFVYNDLLRTIVGQQKSTIDFREAMDSGKIVLMDLRKGILGQTNSHFLGMILVGMILKAALSRTEVKDKSTLREFYLYVDEFHNLATPSFLSILSEARKYKLVLTLTNQYIAQLEQAMIQGILGNVGTLISFRVGSQDAAILSKEFAGVVSENDLLGLSNWNAYVKLLIDGDIGSPFHMRTLVPEKSPNPRLAEKIIAHSRKRYSRPRSKVEEEVRKSWLCSED